MANDYSKFFSTYNNVEPPPFDVNIDLDISPNNKLPTFNFSTSVNDSKSLNDSTSNNLWDDSKITMHKSKKKSNNKSNDKPNGDITKKEATGSIKSIMETRGDIIRDVYNTLIDENFTPEQACGILGNIMQESAFNPTISTGDGGKSYGLFLFYKKGELPIYNTWKIKNSLRIKNKPEHIVLTIFVADRMKNAKFKAIGMKTETAYNYFNSNDPTKVAEGFNALFEKSADYRNPKGLNRRKKYAQEFYNYFN